MLARVRLGSPVGANVGTMWNGNVSPVGRLTDGVVRCRTRPGRPPNQSRDPRAAGRQDDEGHRPGDRAGGLAARPPDGQGIRLGAGDFWAARRRGVLELELPAELWPYVVPKGSIAVDGVSLTVGPHLHAGRCELFLIPYTWGATTLQRLRPGDAVNVETDILGRYVAHLLYAPPITRGGVLVLEDLVPVQGVTVELRVPEKITAAFTALPKKTAKLARGKGAVSVAGVTVSCHTMVVFRY